MEEYIPLLHKEPLERVKAFLMWRVFLTPEILQLKCGEQWMNRQHTMSFLRLMRGAGCPLPQHLADCRDLTASDRNADHCKTTVMFILQKNIEAGNAGFFRHLASLMEAPPAPDDYAAYLAKVANHLSRRKILYAASDQTPRGKNYLQKLLLALTDVYIRLEHQLPRLAELRAGLVILVENPPKPRQLNKALQALGLFNVKPPVLMP